MKVEEAKEKVCPFMPFVSQKLDADGIEIQHFNSNCICNKCMAWEYTKTHEQIENKSSSNMDAPIMSRYSDGAELKEGKKEGYCIRLSSC